MSYAVFVTTSRVLYYFPIIHTQDDMGKLSQSIRRQFLRRLGRRAWQRKEAVTSNLWSEIEKKVDELGLAYEKVRLYQDGLPVCGKERQIVEDLAGAGSKNHQLLVRLANRGATVMGTESAELLVQEYELVKQVLEAADDGRTAENEEERRALSESILQSRDRFIAERINNTLKPGEAGIIFMGMLHSLHDWLDSDIQVNYPVTEPGRKGGRVPQGSKCKMH